MQATLAELLLNFHKNNGLPFFERTQYILKTDASLEGYGGAVVPTGEGEVVHVAGRWDTHKQGTHINELELQTVWEVITVALKCIQGCNITLWLDNTVALSYIRRGGGR